MPYNTENRIDEINQLLGKPPSRLVRIGTYGFLFIFILLIGSSLFIQIPITIKSEVLIEVKVNQFNNSKEQVTQVNIIGKTEVSAHTSSNLAIGQSAIISLYGYSPINYGHLVGVVDNIRLSDTKDTYQIELRLPNGLKTSKGIKLESNFNLKGEVNIVTNQQSLYSLLTDPIIGDIKK
ncbi:MAG: hypothetical protein CL663_01255 [Bacteroidetes bacterium]|nr:hypothetical protein [Bacteroidota bacterium]|tara:strand:+ start:107 stop:643 length:537 start_codon:yes stop_codon:yes gene_type:complete